MKIPVIVAIPACNEAAHIASCLTSLSTQPGASRDIGAVALYANNCNDDTVAAARSIPLPFPMHVVEADLPPERAHIGYARRGATDAAFECIAALGLDNAVIAGTDADSCVTSNWLAALLSAFSADIAAVCGAIELEGTLPCALSESLAAEAAYADAVARISHLLDPLPHDPWPKHIWCWGANFAVRAKALAAVGGSPLVNLAEDRALHAELLRCDMHIRHSLDVRVRTSSRAAGRAPGGLADQIRRYSDDPEVEADFELEPAGPTVVRAGRRGEARRNWGSREGFGAHWAKLEASDPNLAKKRVRLADLPSETAKLTLTLRVVADRSYTAENGADRGLPFPYLLRQ